MSDKVFFYPTRFWKEGVYVQAFILINRVGIVAAKQLGWKYYSRKALSIHSNTFSASCRQQEADSLILLSATPHELQNKIPHMFRAAKFRFSSVNRKHA